MRKPILTSSCLKNALYNMYQVIPHTRIAIRYLYKPAVYRCSIALGDVDSPIKYAFESHFYAFVFTLSDMTPILLTDPHQSNNKCQILRIFLHRSHVFRML